MGKRKYDTKSFIEKAKKLHGDKYLYDKVDYKDFNSKVIITCPTHSNFLQSASKHLKGEGCPECSKYSSFRRSVWIQKTKGKKRIPVLYFIKLWNNNEKFYKVGITNRSVNLRFCNTNLNGYKYETIKTYKLSPESVWDVEKLIMRQFKELKYVPKNPFDGKFECFSSLEPILLCIDSIILNNCLTSTNINNYSWVSA